MVVVLSFTGQADLTAMHHKYPNTFVSNNQALISIYLQYIVM